MNNLYPPLLLKREFAAVFALMLFVILVWIRMPAIMWEGRFWAEEGRVYYHNAWTYGFWLAVARPEMGYLSLVPNVATSIARYMVSIKNAPHVTTGIALLIQTLPLMCLIGARDGWLRKPWVVIAGACILATPPIGDEVWINTPNSQFHIAVLLIFVLMLSAGNSTSTPSRVLRALLVFVPLSSPSTIALVPLFAIRSLFERSMSRAIQTTLLIIGSLCQLLFFYSTMPGRGHILGPATVISIIAARHVVYPLFGFNVAKGVSDCLQASLRAGHFPFSAAILVCFVVALLIFALWRTQNSSALWLCAGAVVMGATSYSGALAPGVELIAVDTGQRYAFASSVAVDFAILCLASTGNGLVPIASRCIVGWLIAIGLMQAALPHPSFIANGPDWAQEVVKWSVNPSRSLGIWPTGWTMTLPIKAFRASGL